MLSVQVDQRFSVTSTYTNLIAQIKWTWEGHLKSAWPSGELDSTWLVGHNCRIFLTTAFWLMWLRRGSDVFLPFTIELTIVIGLERRQQARLLRGISASYQSHCKNILLCGQSKINCKRFDYAQ